MTLFVVSKYFVNDLACKAMKFAEIFFNDTMKIKMFGFFEMCPLKINFQISITPEYVWHKYTFCTSLGFKDRFSVLLLEVELIN